MAQAPKIIQVDPTQTKTRLTPQQWEQIRPVIENLNAIPVHRDVICRALSAVVGFAVKRVQLEYHADKWNCPLYDARKGSSAFQPETYALAYNALSSVLIPRSAVLNLDVVPALSSGEEHALEDQQPAYSIPAQTRDPGSTSAHGRPSTIVKTNVSTDELDPETELSSEAMDTSDEDGELTEFRPGIYSTSSIFPNSGSQRGRRYEGPGQANLFYNRLLERFHTAWCNEVDGNADPVAERQLDFWFALSGLPAANCLIFEAMYQTWHVAKVPCDRIHLAVCCGYLAQSSSQIQRALHALRFALKSILFLQGRQSLIWRPYAENIQSKLRILSEDPTVSVEDREPENQMFYGSIIPLAWWDSTANETFHARGHLSDCPRFRAGVERFFRESYQMILEQITEISEFLTSRFYHQHTVNQDIHDRSKNIIVGFLVVGWLQRREDASDPPTPPCGLNPFCRTAMDIRWALIPAAAEVLCHRIFRKILQAPTGFPGTDEYMYLREIQYHLDLRVELCVDELMLNLLGRLFDSSHVDGRTTETSVNACGDMCFAMKIAYDKQTPMATNEDHDPQPQGSSGIELLSEMRRLLSTLSEASSRFLSTIPVKIGLGQYQVITLPLLTQSWLHTMPRESPMEQESASNVPNAPSGTVVKPASHPEIRVAQDRESPTGLFTAREPLRQKTVNSLLAKTQQSAERPTSNFSNHSARSFERFAKGLEKARISVISLHSQKSGLSGVSSLFNRHSNRFSVVTGFPPESIVDDPMDVD